MPVDGSQSFKGKEGARSSCECFMIKYLFKNLKQQIKLFLNQFLICCRLQAVEGFPQVSGISEISIEMVISFNIFVDDLSVAVCNHFFEQFRFLNQAFRYIILLQKSGQILVGIEYIAVLVFPVKRTVTKSIHNVSRFFRT